MSRFASVLVRSAQPLRVALTHSLTKSAAASSLSSCPRYFSTFSSSTASQSPAAPSTASTRRSSTVNPTAEMMGSTTTSPREMPLSELNVRGKELSGEDHDMDNSATPLMDAIDSNLAAQPPTQDDLVFEQMRLSDILKQKQRYGSTIHSVSETDTIVAATELMAHMNIGAVLVRDGKNSDKIAGIVSTRDFVRKIQEKSLNPMNSPVSAFMTPSPVFAYSDDTAISCLHLMTKHNFRHLPVRARKQGSSEEKTVGLVSIGDLVRVMLKQYRESNVYLREYIDGKYGI